MAIKKQILHVEDNPDIQDLVATTLILQGHQVVSASSFHEGAEQIAKTRFQLYIFDLNLPGGTGMELCRRTLAFNPEAIVLFYSASMYEAFRPEALKMGAKEFILKPEIEKLEKAVIKYLNPPEELNEREYNHLIDAQRTLLRIEWYRKMTEAYKTMPESLREELEDWVDNNRERADVSDWPGWRYIIGDKPK